MIGFVAENQLTGKVDIATWKDLENIDENTVILDVMEDEERKLGHIKNSIHIPLGQLRASLDELDKSKNYIVYCAVGLRGYIASRIMKQRGFKVKNLAGGFTTYKTMFCQRDEENCIGLKEGPMTFSDTGVQRI